jgi:hypothetical protein
MQLDPVRTRLLKLIQARDTDLKHASLALGRNAAYLRQFIFRGSPKVLPENLRKEFAKHLGCEDDELRHRKVPPRKPRTPSPAPLNLGVVGYGFLLFLVSSLLWTAAGVAQREPSLVVLQGAFTAINVPGIYRWFG